MAKGERATTQAKSLELFGVSQGKDSNQMNNSGEGLALLNGKKITIQVQVEVPHHP